MNFIQAKGTPFSGTGSEASGSAVATEAAVSGRVHFVTGISGSSSDATANIVLSAGSSNEWQDRIGNAGAYVKDFNVPIRFTAGTAAIVTVTTGSGGDGFANIEGYSIDNT